MDAVSRLSLSSHNPYDAWERRSLRQQERAISQLRTAPSTDYSRGPEILVAMEKLRKN